MTRNGDYNLADSKENEKRSDLSNRKQLIFENDPMAVISIHQNSYPSSDVHGAQVFYPQGSEKSKQLADHIQSALIKGLIRTITGRQRQMLSIICFGIILIRS